MAALEAAIQASTSDIRIAEPLDGRVKPGRDEVGAVARCDSRHTVSVIRPERWELRRTMKSLSLSG